MVGLGGGQGITPKTVRKWRDRLSAIDPRPTATRYEREQPGELIHIDIKKLGHIDGTGHRITGARTDQSNRRASGKGLGWEYLHVAIDDRSAERHTAMHPWLHADNTARPHSALGGKPPISRITRENILGSDT